MYITRIFDYLHELIDVYFFHKFQIQISIEISIGWIIFWQKVDFNQIQYVHKIGFMNMNFWQSKESFFQTLINHTYLQKSRDYKLDYKNILVFPNNFRMKFLLLDHFSRIVSFQHSGSSTIPSRFWRKTSKFLSKIRIQRIRPRSC